MRVVLDTNVFISGVFFTGPPFRILKAWSEGEMDIVLTPEILDEYQRAAEKLNVRFPDVEITPVLALVAASATLIQAPALAEAVCADAEDDKFVAAAMAAQCGIIVSGDKHLLDVTGYRGIRVLRPRAYVDEYLG